MQQSASLLAGAPPLLRPAAPPLLLLAACLASLRNRQACFCAWRSESSELLVVVR
jgi:hypothetical protein